MTVGLDSKLSDIRCICNHYIIKLRMVTTTDIPIKYFDSKDIQNGDKSEMRSCYLTVLYTDLC